MARTVDDYESLFQYTQWANGRILTALDSVEDPPDRAVELLSHLLRAQDVWYGRVQDTELADLSLWVDEGLAACAERATDSARRWNELVEACSDGVLDRTVSYKNSSGTRFETPLRDILSHVVNHGTHHRAQIAHVLREADMNPPATDYIFFVRDA